MTQYLVKVCPTRTNSAVADRSVTDRKETYKHHIFAPTASTHCLIYPKLCMVMEDFETTKNHFLIQCIDFPTGCTENFGLND